MKPYTHGQPQDSGASCKGFQPRLAFQGEDQSFDKKMAPWLLGYKKFIDEGNIYSRYDSPSNSLFLSYSLSSVILNSYRTPQRTEQTSSSLKSQGIDLSHIYWTFSQEG